MRLGDEDTNNNHTRRPLNNVTTGMAHLPLTREEIMTIFVNKMKITRVNTRTRYWNKKQQKYLDLKKPIVEREDIGTCEPYDLENYLKTIFFHLDAEGEKGYGANDRVHLEITANFDKEIY